MKILKKCILNLAALSLALQSVSCASTQPKTADFDQKTKIQTIELTRDDFYLYAQDDLLLKNKNLDSGLMEVNTEWVDELKSAKRFEAAGVTTSLIGFLSLIGCLVADSDSAVLGWCAGSIGMSLVSIPLGKKARKKRHNVVTEYNSKY